MSGEATQIPIKKKTRQKLRNIGIKGKTYDELINELISIRERLEEREGIRTWFEDNFRTLGFKEMKKKGETPGEYVMETEEGEVRVKLETLSSNFFRHEHDTNEIDMVICLLENEKLPVDTVEILGLKTVESGHSPKTGETGYKKISTLSKLARTDDDIKSVDEAADKLAVELGEDSDTMSSLIAELSEEGLADRGGDPKDNGLWTVTPEGISLLRSLWTDLKELFGEISGRIKLDGRLISGFGEGGYYISKEGYQRQFREKLGFEPYPGTLDLELKPGSLKFKRWLENERGVKIEGFSTEERSYGGAKCFPAVIMGEEAAVILPSRTHHEEDILELISPVKVRDKYDLEDGDELKVEVEL